MIVKDEELAMPGTIDSVSTYLDYYTILDTGVHYVSLCYNHLKGVLGCVGVCWGVLGCVGVSSWVCTWVYLWVPVGVSVGALVGVFTVRVFMCVRGSVRGSVRAYAGSTDNTVEVIKKRFEAAGVPGQVFEEPFVDFSTSRNRSEHVHESDILLSASRYIIIFCIQSS